MIRLFLLLAVTSICYTLYHPITQQNNETNQPVILEKLKSMARAELNFLNSQENSLKQIKTMLQNEAQTLNADIINKVLTILQHTDQYNITHNHILTIIDYSLTADKKRLWIFDLNEKKLLFNTYVSHGIKSGALLANNFSNKYNSKCSSIGVYKTEKTYYGRDGLSLRLTGLERGFNDNASNRSIVMHGSWYVEEPFIKKYGRSGRSWGCPAIPLELAKPIIETIKDNSLFIVYYPSDDWFLKSKFLKDNTKSYTQIKNNPENSVAPYVDPNDQREDVLFAHINKQYKSEENEAIVVMPADVYAVIFNSHPPLKRMLRRQINQAEYIALSNTEFNHIVNQKKDYVNAMYFAIPVIKQLRTEMKIINLGQIKEVKANSNTFKNNTYTVYFENKPAISLRSTDRFIRWLGL